MGKVISNDASIFAARGDPIVLALTTTNKHVGTDVTTLNPDGDTYFYQIQVHRYNYLKSECFYRLSF